ncbi:Serine/threonine-protein kinase Sgk3 [Balamuthia mandrillaris]
MEGKEGWMTKEGGSYKSWKKRWCVVEKGHLNYYTKKGGDLKGSIPLAKVSDVSSCSYKDKKNCMQVISIAHERTYYFTAETPEALKEWLDVLDFERKKASGPAGKGVTLEDFKSLKVIGRGSFGKVLQVKYIPNGQVYAMKVLTKKAVIERDEFKNVQYEKSILMKLDCPFLVKLYFSFQSPDKLYFVLDYINGGELFFHLQQSESGTFNAERVRFYSAEIVLGIAYLHSKGIIYRDLKPENLLLTADGHICMTDFGISKEGLNCKNDRTATFCGTPEYLAPEVLEGKEYGKEVDWWSLGILMYEMSVGIPPFYTEDVQQMYRKIMEEELDLTATIKDPNARSLIAALLERDPAKRLSDPETIKQHPYFSSIDWEKLAKKLIVPPFVPKVAGKEDVSQIDPMFTSENAALTLNPNDDFSQTMQKKFDGFTYVAEDVVGGEASK